MPKLQCVKCESVKLMGKGSEPPELCLDCKSSLHRELNRIDRKDDRYTKRGKIKNRLSDIPDDAMDENLALHVEEVADPEIEERSMYLGKLKEIKIIEEDEARDIDNDYELRHEGKKELKERYK